MIWSTLMIHALQRIVKCTAPCYNGNKNYMNCLEMTIYV